VWGSAREGASASLRACDSGKSGRLEQVEVVESGVKRTHTHAVNLVISESRGGRERARGEVIRAAAECIGRVVGFARNVMKVEVILRESLHPASLAGCERGLTEEVSDCRVV
jgi:hypothetical protein